MMILEVMLCFSKILMVLFTISLLTWLLYVLNARRNLPPGPFPMPFIGNMWHFSNFRDGYSATWMNLTKIYGSPCTFWLCCEPMVITATHDQAQYVMSGGGRDIFVSKRRSLLMDVSGHANGLSFIPHGSQWIAQRRILHQCLRTHASDELLQTQCEMAIDDAIVGLPNQPIAPRLFVAEITRNVILSLIFFHRRRKLTEIDRQHMAALRSVIFYQFEPQSWTDFFPLLRSLPYTVQTAIVRVLTPVGKQATKCITETIAKIIDEHKQKMLENGGIETDLVDGLINAFNREASTDSSVIKEENLKYVVTDLTSDTTESALSTILVQLAYNSEDQQKCFEEVKAIFGKSRPTLDKRRQLPYLEACIYESLRTRLSSEISFSRFVSTKIAVIGGYTLPPDTMVVPIHQYYSLNSADGFVSANPYAFKPTRFLDDDRQFNSRKDDFWPFSAAKRDCAGKGIAQRFLILTVAGLLQKLRFELQPAPEIPSYISSIDDLKNLLMKDTTKLVICKRE